MQLGEPAPAHGPRMRAVSELLLERGADPNRSGSTSRLPWSGIPLEMALLPASAAGPVQVVHQVLAGRLEGHQQYIADLSRQYPLEYDTRYGAAAEQAVPVPQAQAQMDRIASGLRERFPIKKTSDLVQEITAASEEQAAGVGPGGRW